MFCRKYRVITLLVCALATSVLALDRPAALDEAKSLQPQALDIIGKFILTERFALEPVDITIMEPIDVDREEERESSIKGDVIRTTNLKFNHTQYSVRMTYHRLHLDMRELDLNDLADGLDLIKSQYAHLIENGSGRWELEYGNAAVNVHLGYDGESSRVRFTGMKNDKRTGTLHGQSLDHLDHLDHLAQFVSRAQDEIAKLKAETK
jgi:hypothetical protein